MSSPTPTPVSTSELPSDRVLQMATMKAIEEDRPICLDYYADSWNGKAFIGQTKTDKKRLLIKNSEEYTSLITKLYKVDDCYLILTENSLYVVSAKTNIKWVTSTNPSD
jgi:hypothetical protein